MKSFPRVAAKTLDGLVAWCQSVERLREDDCREVDGIQRGLGPVKRLYASVTTVGNVGAGEDNLITYELPDGLLTADGYGFVIEAGFTFAANANNKRIRAYLGSTSLFDTTATAFNNNCSFRDFLYF